MSPGHCWTRPFHLVCWHEISAPWQVRRKQLKWSHDAIGENKQDESFKSIRMIDKPCFVCVPQGEAGGTRSASESSTHGVRHCTYWLSAHLCDSCTGHRAREVNRSGCIIPQAKLKLLCSPLRSCRGWGSSSWTQRPEARWGIPILGRWVGKKDHVSLYDSGMY